MSKHIETMIVASSFAGYQNQLLQASDGQHLVPLQAELFLDRESLLSAVHTAWAASKLPCFYAPAEDAFSIQALFPDLPFTFLFVAPKSIAEYWNAISQEPRDLESRIRALKKAYHTCDLLWKFDAIVGISDLKTAKQLTEALEKSNSNLDSFDVLAFKEGLASCIQRLERKDLDGL